jgi:recombination protein RecR
MRDDSAEPYHHAMREPSASIPSSTAADVTPGDGLDAADRSGHGDGAGRDGSSPAGVSGGAGGTGESAEPAGNDLRSGSSARRGGYPAVVDRLMEALASLPGIGRRSAERLAFHILKSPPDEASRLAQAITDVKARIRHCRACSNLTDSPEDQPLCDLCAGLSRDRQTVLVVEQPKDLIALEQTGMYKGLYHVLMGRISPLDGIGPEELTVSDLFRRLDRPDSNPGGVAIKEVVLGLNPTVEGDGTSLYLMQEIGSRPGMRVTRLARGLPTGSQLEYANKAVLADAIQCRQEVR